MRGKSLTPTTTSGTLDVLREFESRNILFTEPDGSWPMVWAKAKGVWVWNPEGRRFLDLTAAFGVAAAGHACPVVVRAGQKQMATLLHAMGDVHPHPGKAELARKLSELTFDRWTRSGDCGAPKRGKTIFCNSGFEAVEAALKTAQLATERSGVIAFENGYHGLGYGTLNATDREHFRGPFRKQLANFCSFVPFPSSTGGREDTGWKEQVESLLVSGQIGAVLVEPIQARGGINIPPPTFLPELRALCDRHGALLILDEIYTGFGRTGRWFACEHSGVVPDLICLGKALTGGFPLSACVGEAGLMDRAWPESNGEAIHTSTFLGNPVGCAMAVAQIKEIDRRRLVVAAANLGPKLCQWLQNLAGRLPQYRTKVRVQGLMAGLELHLPTGAPATRVVLDAIKAMLQRGFILLPEGLHGEVISFTPPLTISGRALHQSIEVLGEVLGALPVR